MSDITVPFNPYQDKLEARIIEEIIPVIGTTTTEVTDENGEVSTVSVPGRVEYVPRKAPFFGTNVVLRMDGVSTPLEFGKDYVFGRAFDRAREEYRRGFFGSIILLKELSGNLLATYDSLGSPFILDDVAFAEYVANIMNEERHATWDQINPDSIPTTFPIPDHPHPFGTAMFNADELLLELRSLVIAMSGGVGGVTSESVLQDHLTEKLPQAHAVDLEALGLDKVPNIPRATSADYSGANDNVLVTMKVLKQVLFLFVNGEISLDGLEETEEDSGES